MPKLRDVFEIVDDASETIHVFEVSKILEEPNTGLVEIAETLGVNTFKFTMPGAIIDELVKLSTCKVCGKDNEEGLKACPSCYESARRKSQDTPGIRELARDNTVLQMQLEQITKRRADALEIIEEQRAAIQALKERLNAE